MRKYLPLHQKEFSYGYYTLTPIRDEDKYAIMQWRNAQIEVLRQAEPLTERMQEHYFATVVNNLFEQEKPTQLLFSFLENNQLIGYGGLVHINWENKTAEISYLTPLERANNETTFIHDWFNYLKILKRIADVELHFNSIFTYAYDLRPQLYTALLKSGFAEKERIKNATIIAEKKVDVLIHEFVFEPLIVRQANENDLMTYFYWTNDDEVRENSFNQQKITLKEHTNWFKNQLKNSNNQFYIFFDKTEHPIGQVRIHKTENEVIIGVSVDKESRGKNYAARLIAKASYLYLLENNNDSIFAYIKLTNTSSLNAFVNAGYKQLKDVEIDGNKSFKLVYKQ